MPNGGMLPCCFVCDHGKSNLEDSSVACTVHDFVVHHGTFAFCRQLSMYGESQKTAFSELSDEMVYDWVQIAYTTQDNPTLPQYHHQIEPLASIAEYRSWTLSDHTKASQVLHEKVKREFLDKSDSD
jgi:hypothetical protein